MQVEMKLRIKVDNPQLPGGLVWIDVEYDDKAYTVVYRPETGYGLYTQANYGRGPDETYPDLGGLFTRLIELHKNPHDTQGT